MLSDVDLDDSHIASKDSSGKGILSSFQADLCKLQFHLFTTSSPFPCMFLSFRVQSPSRHPHLEHIQYQWASLVPPSHWTILPRGGSQGMPIATAKLHWPGFLIHESELLVDDKNCVLTLPDGGYRSIAKVAQPPWPSLEARASEHIGTSVFPMKSDCKSHEGCPLSSKSC